LTRKYTDTHTHTHARSQQIGELGMLVASCPGVTCVSPADVSAEMLARERDIEMNKEDIKSKPEAIRCVCVCVCVRP